MHGTICILNLTFEKILSIISQMLFSPWFITKHGISGTEIEFCFAVFNCKMLEIDGYFGS